MEIYSILLSSFGFQKWWPVHKGIDRFLEVSIGAILTQNTNWKNVEKAIQNLLDKGVLSWEALEKIDIEKLKELIKPAGFYNQKAIYIKNFVKNVKGIPKEKITRKYLLSIKGIGEETADSILLYGLDRLYFVVDAYTKRIFYRLGIIKDKNISYKSLQNLIMENIPKNLEIYKEYHALLVELGKNFCKRKPECSKCPLNNLCDKNLN